MSVYADEDIFVTETNILDAGDNCDNASPDHHQTWSPEDTCHHEGRGVISSHHGPLVIYLFFNFIYFSIMIQIAMMRWSLDINVLERSVQCFLFNRALQVF